MADLRQRLADALSGEVKASWYPPTGDMAGSWHFEFGDMPDAVLAVFAEWLAERARAVREAGNAPDPQDGLSWYDRGAAVAALESAAEDLAPQS